MNSLLDRHTGCSLASLALATLISVLAALPCSGFEDRFCSAWILAMLILGVLALAGARGRVRLGATLALSVFILLAGLVLSRGPQRNLFLALLYFSCMPGGILGAIAAHRFANRLATSDVKALVTGFCAMAIALGLNASWLLASI